MVDYKQVFQLAQDKGYKRWAPILLEDYEEDDDEFWAISEAAMLQKWLRDEHKLHIYIDTTPAFDRIHISKWKAHVKVPFQPFKWTTAKYYVADSYEDALLEGIHQAIKLIP